VISLNKILKDLGDLLRHLGVAWLVIDHLAPLLEIGLLTATLKMEDGETIIIEKIISIVQQGW